MNEVQGRNAQELEHGKMEKDKIWRKSNAFQCSKSASISVTESKPNLANIFRRRQVAWSCTRKIFLPCLFCMCQDLCSKYSYSSVPYAVVPRRHSFSSTVVQSSLALLPSNSLPTCLPHSQLRHISPWQIYMTIWRSRLPQLNR